MRVYALSRAWWFWERWGGGSELMTLKDWQPKYAIQGIVKHSVYCEAFCLTILDCIDDNGLSLRDYSCPHKSRGQVYKVKTRPCLKRKSK